MNKTVALAAMLVFLLGACTKKTETTVTETGESSSTTVSAEVPAVEVDTAATAAATAATTEAVNDAAHATGTAMEKAGQAIQDNTTTRKN
jgi:hypothetical protein